MFDCACQNKPTNYPLRQSWNPTVCHSVGITEFVLKKLNHEESADNTNAKIILPLHYLTTVLFLLADINNISFITMPKQIQKKTHPTIKQLGSCNLYLKCRA